MARFTRAASPVASPTTRRSPPPHSICRLDAIAGDAGNRMARERTAASDQLTDATRVYRGRKIKFRMLDGSYRLRFEGTGIHFSAVGRGWVTFDGDDRFENDGVYSLNGAPFEPIPVDLTEKIKLQVGPFKPQRGRDSQP